MFEIIRSLLSGEGLGIQHLVHIFVLIFIVVCCNPVHESAHAWTADKLGDPTGRLKGRITMNPLRHLDPIGAIMLLLFGFGYAKAVPVNIRNFPAKKRKLYFAVTAAAGPVSNLILALFFAVLEMLCRLAAVKSGSTLAEIGVYFFLYANYINIALAVFNLIPFPPLDGSRLVTAVLPDKIYYKLMGYERYTMIALFVLIFLFNRIGFSPISWLTGVISDGMRTPLAKLFGVL